VHVLATDGAFLPDASFVPLPAVPEGLLAEQFRRAVLEFLVQQQALSKALCTRLLGWRHSGFSVHNQVRVGEQDAAGTRKLAAHGQGQHAVGRPARFAARPPRRTVRAKRAGLIFLSVPVPE
jgi:hypothetical protein